MVTKTNPRLQESTCEHLFLLALFGDEVMRSRVDAELDRRARLRPHMSGGTPRAGTRGGDAKRASTRPLRLPMRSPSLAG